MIARESMQQSILDRLAQRVSLKSDTEESHLASKMRKAVSKIKSKQNGRKKVHARGGLSSMGARNIFIKDSDIYSRRVVVKARYIKNSGNGFKEKIRAHLEYVSRNNAGIDGNKPELFSHDESNVEIKNVVKLFEKSPHNFRFIVSPEEGNQLDMKSFTNDLVKAIEIDLKTKVTWVAACHYDTNEPHVHLVINGANSDGQKLTLSRDYITRGIRIRAAEIVTKKIGLRDIDEIANSLEIDVNKNKKCELDTVIKNHIIDDKINISKISTDDFDINWKKLISMRLSYLEKYNFCSHIDGDLWSIKKDYTKDLQQLYRTSSIIEKISLSSNVLKENCEIISAQKLSEKSITGQVISRSYIDDIEDKEYLIIKNQAHKHIYVELEKYSEKKRVDIGDMVKIEATKAFLGPKNSDHTVNDLAKAQGGIYAASAHEHYIQKNVSLPPAVSAKEYVQVHLKRLEVLARMGLVNKIDDKTFDIPKDFIAQIANRAKMSANTYRPHIKVKVLTEPIIKQQSLSPRIKP